MAIKVLDALASGMAIITSETGARGHGTKTRAAMRIVPDGDAQAFADAVVEAATSPQEVEQLEEASALAVENWNGHQAEALVRALGL